MLTRIVGASSFCSAGIGCVLAALAGSSIARTTLAPVIAEETLPAIGCVFCVPLVAALPAEPDVSLARTVCTGTGMTAAPTSRPSIVPAEATGTGCDKPGARLAERSIVERSTVEPSTADSPCVFPLETPGSAAVIGRTVRGATGVATGVDIVAGADAFR